MIKTGDVKPIGCCYLGKLVKDKLLGGLVWEGCGEDAEWIITDEDSPMDPGTYSCSEHLAKMLTDRNCVVSMVPRPR